MKIKVLSFGEALWDVFSDGKALGGAPANFSGHLAKLGAEAYLLTGVGADENGRELAAALAGLGVRGDYITLDPAHPTGVCRVTRDEGGEPSYDLAQNTAYDSIRLTAAQRDGIRTAGFDALYFGTLAQRGAASRAALEQLFAQGGFGEYFCDLNLRGHFYDRELVTRCLERATILKLNREEWKLLRAMGLADGSGPENFCKALCEAFQLGVVIVTLDRDGALGYRHEDGRFVKAAPLPVKAVSPVGAGDSFSACFLYHYLLGTDLALCLQKANRLGAYVAGVREAVPEYPPALLRELGAQN